MLDSTSEEVRNGTIVNPWNGTSPAFTRAIVQLPGCTGTMVAASWVLTAKHCGLAAGATATSVRSGGNIVRTADRAVNHATLDVTLLHLATPMPVDVPAALPYLGSETSLENQAVDVYGYGAMGAYAVPAGGCRAGTWEQGGNCLTPSADLRKATVTATSTGAGTFWMPINGAGQMILPGDSGGPAFRTGKIAGVNSWWNFDLLGGGDVSVPAFRPWMDRTIGRVLADYDGDRRTDIGVWRPSNGTWYTIDSDTGGARVVQWGQQGDQPIVADFDGDGRSDAAIWRVGTGTWYVKRSSDGGVTSQQWGQIWDVPVAADYDGDGKADFAIWRPSTGTWHVIQSSNGAVVSTQWGQRGDGAVPGDYDGDGRADLAVWRPANGTWYVLRSSDGGWSGTVWGVQGDSPVAGDFDGDGRRDLAIFRGSESRWYVLPSSTGAGYWRGWGQSGDQRAAGDYDGDGRTDMAVFRPSTGAWYVWTASDTAYSISGWGQSGDYAIPGQTY